jgi:hypothetical protein
MTHATIDAVGPPVPGPCPPRRPRRPISRGIRLTAPGSLTIRTDSTELRYKVEELVVGGAFDGRGFRVTREDTGDVYDVFLSRNGQDDLCDCRGFSAHGHCKHRDGLKTLLRCGALDRRMSVAAPDRKPVGSCPECGGEVFQCHGEAECADCPVAFTVAVPF